MPTDSGTAAELVILVVKEHRHVEDILTGFLELGIRGATVVEAKGMGQIISTDIPIFSGFKALFPGGGAQTFMILSVMEKGLVGKAADIAEEVCGSFSNPGTGFLFTLPVADVRGMAREIS